MSRLISQKMNISSLLKQFLRKLFIYLFSFLVITLTVLTWQLVKAQSGNDISNPKSQAENLINSSQTPTPTSFLISTSIPITDQKDTIISHQSLGNQSFNELIIFSKDDNGYFHLFSFNPYSGEIYRITFGAWDDITPAISPNGKWLAFASNRSGQWDIYIMQISTGILKQLTNTPEYDGFPSWSPDNQWIIFETYKGDDLDANLDVEIISVVAEQQPLQLTTNPSADMAPAWSPEGRWIAFVSTRSGNRDIWLVNLDNYDFKNLTNTPHQSEAHPTWSPDGKLLTWSTTTEDGIKKILTWDITQPKLGPKQIGIGSWNIWNPAGDTLLVTLSTPQENFITTFPKPNEGVKIPYQLITGDIYGLTWGTNPLPTPLPESIQDSTAITPETLWEPSISSQSESSFGRLSLVPLPSVSAPNPLLLDTIDESFLALRQHISNLSGWDFLSSLENAYLPLTSTLGPGMVENWFYTGRAFSFNPAPINANWVVVIKEDIGTETYWRIFVKCRFQSGSQGIPLRDIPWDFNARFSNRPLAYENGGALASSIPKGYWIDFTRIAKDYGWSRSPALTSWQSAFSTAQYNVFIHKDDKDWFSAMLELYPPEALDTPTPVPSPTPAIEFNSTITASPTSTVTATPTQQKNNINSLFNYSTP